MIRHIVTGGMMMAAAIVTDGNVARAEQAASAASRTGTVTANGIDYAYRITGEGDPLLILHGGLGSMDMFDPILPILQEGRQIIAVDLHGHGRTRLGDRPLSLVDMGDDLAVVVGELGYASVDVLGYSMGGGVAFRFAVQHPALVRRLILASAPFSQDGFYPEMLPQQAQVGAAAAAFMKETPMYRGYVAVAPVPEDFPRLLDAVGAQMRTPYDWMDDLERLTMPVMLVYGDADMVRLDHVVEAYNRLGGGLRDAGWQREHMATNRLAILPDVTHYEAFMSPLLAEAAVRFLDGAPPPVWTGE